MANYPHFAGLTLDQVRAGLAEFTASPAFGGLVVTEVNPDHDPDGDLVRTLAHEVAAAVAAAWPAGLSYRHFMPVATSIVIAGAGFAGLGMAIALKKAGCRAAYVVSAPRPAAAVAR